MKGLLRVLDSTGDTRVPFDTDNPASLKEAQEVFDRLKAKGYSAFSAPAGGTEPAKRISTLGEATEETLLISPITGG